MFDVNLGDIFCDAQEQTLNIRIRTTVLNDLINDLFPDDLKRRQINIFWFLDQEFCDIIKKTSILKTISPKLI